MYKVITENLSDDEVLWRYMDVSKFLSLLSKKTLWLARSDTFRDKREGVFHKSMRAELEKIYYELDLKGNIIDQSEISNVEEFQSYLSNNTYISCWHKNSSESMVMWEVYGQTENSIAIKTTAEKLKTSFDLQKVYKELAIEIALDDVSYVDHNACPSDKNYRQPFFIKRPHFSFESEVRLYLFARHKKSRSDAPIGLEIEVDLSTLIDEIYVHPDAENWFFESIKDLVQKYDITANVLKGAYGNKF